MVFPFFLIKKRVMLFTPYTFHHSQVVQLCRGAGADNLTVLSTRYISPLTHIMYHIPFFPGLQIGYGGAELRVGSPLTGAACGGDDVSGRCAVVYFELQAAV